MTQITIQIPEKHIEIPEKHMEILRLLKQGFTVKEIQAKVFMSDSTIERTKYFYIAQFNCRNATHLIATLIENGIL